MEFKIGKHSFIHLTLRFCCLRIRRFTVSYEVSHRNWNYNPVTGHWNKAYEFGIHKLDRRKMDTLLPSVDYFICFPVSKTKLFRIGFTIYY